MAQLPVNGPRVEITGNRSIVVDGCDGVIDYSSDFVKLRLGRMTLEIRGRDLHLNVLTEQGAVISGFVQTLEYGY